MKIAVVISNLLVGPCPYDRKDCKQLKSEGVTAILNLQTPEDLGERTLAEAESDAKAAHLAFRNVPVNDFDVLDLKRKLPDCVKALQDLLGSGHTVYVHCTAGVTRSPTVAAAYLHWHLHWPLEKAIDQLHSVRNCCPLADVIRRAQPAM